MRWWRRALSEPRGGWVSTLDWGVKQTFRSYVHGVGGAILARGGATRSGDGGFTFLAEEDSSLRRDADGTLVGLGRFRGEVTFEGHGGILAVRLADPIIEITPDAAVMSVAEDLERRRRIVIAHLDIGAAGWDDEGLVSVPAILTLEGSQLLGDHYPIRTPLDPLRLRVEA